MISNSNRIELCTYTRDVCMIIKIFRLSRFILEAEFLEHLVFRPITTVNGMMHVKHRSHRSSLW